MPIEKLQTSFTFTKEKIEELKQIIPEAFADNQINWELLREALSDTLEDYDSNVEHYGLYWPGKKDSRRMATKPPFETIVPINDESLIVESSKNIFVEGENLEALKILQKSYAGKIKVIYIDPPYNTGNDLIYDDKFTESIEEYYKRTGMVDETGRILSTNKKSDGRFHSKWLNMIYPRIKLSYNLLSQNGLIFISIDDNEVNHLRSVVSEIFGDENFVACIANVNNPKGRSDDKYVATAHEYLLIYKKGDAELFGFEPEEKVLKRYNKSDANGKYREIDLRKTGESDRREDRPKMFYYFLYNQETEEFYPTYDEVIPEGFIQIVPTRKDLSYGRWRWGINTTLENIDRLKPKFMDVRKKWTIVEKDYLSDEERIKPTSAWTFKDVNSERGTEQFVELGFDKEIFLKPKPLGLLKRILEISIRPLDEEIVLDFFAGSGSFAQAVMEYNLQYDGNVRYMVIQFPELIDKEEFAYSKGYKYISEITQDRISRASNLLKSKNEDSKIDFGFRKFKLSKSSFKLWKNYEGLDVNQLEQQFEIFNHPIIEETKLPDLITEILLIEGFTLDCNISKKVDFLKNNIFKITSEFCEHSLLICLDKTLQKDTIKHLDLADNDILICFDSAINDEDKAILADKGLIKTI